MNPAVLFVDDEQSICSALRRTFKKNAFDVFQANSGEQALSILENNAIDVVVSDQRMPGMKGTELLSIVKQRYPSTGRIILSGHSDMKDLASAINDASIYRFIPKPWNDKELLTSVKGAIPSVKMHRSRVLPVQLKKQEGFSPKSSPSKYPTVPASIQKALNKRQIHLEDAIKNNKLTLLREKYQQRGAPENLRLFWPEYTHFPHKGIINLADQSGYLNDLMTWYLINAEYALKQKQGNGIALIFDLFTGNISQQKGQQQWLEKIIQLDMPLIFRLSYETMAQAHFTDLLMEIDRNNSSLLINLGKRVVDLEQFASSSVRYIEMDGSLTSLNNYLLTEKRLKMLANAQNLSIHTILSGDVQIAKINYAKAMGFDFY